MRQAWAYFIAILFAALAAMAHLLELPNKIGLSREDYFTVQAIYRGWALLGVVGRSSIARKRTCSTRARMTRGSASSVSRSPSARNVRASRSRWLGR